MLDSKKSYIPPSTREGRKIHEVFFRDETIFIGNKKNIYKFNLIYVIVSNLS
jgi:hypothetical protein